MCGQKAWLSREILLWSDLVSYRKKNIGKGRKIKKERGQMLKFTNVNF